MSVYKLKRKTGDNTTEDIQLDYDTAIANKPTIPSPLPTTTTAGKVLKSTSTAGTVEWGDAGSTITSIDGLSGGKLTSPLKISGGDAVTASKIALDQTASGQITNNSTQTIFGFTSNNATNLTVGHSSYALALRGSGTRPKYNSDNLALYSDIPTVNNSTLDIQLNGASVNTFTANASSNVTANIKALPNYSVTIGSTNGGNPRQVKFLSVNYTNYDGNNACFIKLGAMCSHGNGQSYIFLDDIFIGVSSTGTVTCDVYKFFQSSAGSLDNANRYYGDVFYTIDTTNKVVDFYILIGQWSTANFTPYTKIGATTSSGITQLSGSPTYYSSGTRVWVNGDSTTYARLSDIPSMWSGTQAEYDAIATKDSNTYYFIQEE